MVKKTINKPTTPTTPTNTTSTNTAPAPTDDEHAVRPASMPEVVPATPEQEAALKAALESKSDSVPDESNSTPDTVPEEVSAKPKPVAKPTREEQLEPKSNDSKLVTEGIKIIKSSGEVRYKLSNYDKWYRTSSPSQLRKDDKSSTIIEVKE